MIVIEVTETNIFFKKIIFSSNFCSASCSTFESAIAAAGVDFRSDKLWEMYVEWEREQGNLKAITGIYDRVLAMPTQMYSHHWEK